MALRNPTEINYSAVEKRRKGGERGGGRRRKQINDRKDRLTNRTPAVKLVKRHKTKGKT